jgi:hypothetical protein
MMRLCIAKKVKFALCLITYATTPCIHGGSGGIGSPVLASALVGCESLMSRHSCFAAEDRAAGTLCIGGWVGPRASLDNVKCMHERERFHGAEPFI